VGRSLEGGNIYRNENTQASHNSSILSQIKYKELKIIDKLKNPGSSEQNHGLSAQSSKKSLKIRAQNSVLNTYKSQNDEYSPGRSPTRSPGRSPTRTSKKSGLNKDYIPSLIR